MPSPPSEVWEYTDPTADAGSGCMPYWEAKERDENWLAALVGPLILPSKGPKEPARECAALDSEPVAEAPGIAIARLRFGLPLGWGYAGWELYPELVVPMGVERWSLGACFLPGVGMGGPLLGVEFRERLLIERDGGCGAPMARAFGEGGMDRPSRGARGVLPRPPGIGGRSIGGGGVDIEVYGGVNWVGMFIGGPTGVCCCC